MKISDGGASHKVTLENHEVKGLKNGKVLPELTYASETWL